MDDATKQSHPVLGDVQCYKFNILVVCIESVEGIEFFF